MVIVRFEDVVKRININVDRHNTDRLYYVGGEHIESEEFMIHDKGLIKGSTIGYKFHYGFNPGHILFMSRNPHLRKASMVDFEGICSDSTYVVETKDESILLQDYLLIEMQSDRFWNWMEEHKTGGVNYLINYRTLNQYKFELPPIEKQKVLAEKLWAAYRLKESYKRLLAATDEMVKSRFIEMFGDKVPKKKILEVCDVRGGSTPTRTTKEYWDNGTVSWFTVEDIYEQGRYISETKQHITELATKKCFVYPTDTVLICCTASVGEYAITKKEMASNQQFNGMMIKDKTELHPEYLLYVASTLKDDLLRQAGKTTINFVSRSKLEDIEIPVPPYSEQLKFVTVYQQADKSKFELRKSIEAIDAVIKSLINN